MFDCLAEGIATLFVFGHVSGYTAFLIEFPVFLSDLVVIADNILIFGDFNIHMESPQTHSKRLSEPSSTRWVLSNMSLDLLTITVILWT